MTIYVSTIQTLDAQIQEEKLFSQPSTVKKEHKKRQKSQIELK